MKIYSRYLRICSAAVADETIFKDFRRTGVYHTVVEGILVKPGKKYIPWIKEHFPYILQHIDTFITSDNIGNPRGYYDKEINKWVSFATCRYIKILAELIGLFGDLNDMDIIEIGGGYGGQCKIIYDYAKPRSYTIVDLPEACKLAAKYLRCFGIENVEFKTPKSDFNETYSLCISNYGFAEFDREYQDLYAENIIKNSERGYMICNFFDENDIPERVNGFTREEINALKTTGKIFLEEPLTADGNFLYVWD